MKSSTSVCINEAVLASTECATEWLVSQWAARQSQVSFQILGLRFRDHIRRQHWRGWSFVPGQGLEVIADELFVEARLSAAWLIIVCRPETRRIGSKHFVDENQPAVEKAERTFRVGDEDATVGGAGEAVG